MVFEMKWNKKYLWIRIVAFPIKLLFSIIWHSLMGIRLSIQWLVCGGQEVYYGKDHGGSLIKIIEQNEKIIKSFNENN